MTHIAAFVTAKDLPALEGLLAVDSLARLSLITPKPFYLVHPKLHQITSINGRWANGVWLKSVYDFFRQSPPDLIYGAGSRSNWFWAATLSRWTERPYMLSLETPILPRPRRFWESIFGRASVLTFPHPWRFANEQSMILPPLIEFPAYTPQARHFEAVYPIYGLGWDELAVDVWWHVVAKVPQARLVMVGKAAPDLAALIGRVGLQNHILLAEGDILEWLKLSQIYFAWHSHDSAPQMAMQAMASGTIPVHRVDVGLDYIIETGKNGILFSDPSETRAIAKSISTLLNDPVYYSQLQEAALKIPTQFSLAAITEAWTAILGAG